MKANEDVTYIENIRNMFGSSFHKMNFLCLVEL